MFFIQPYRELAHGVGTAIGYLIGTISNTIIGCSVLNLVSAMLLIILGDKLSIEFCKDIAWALIFIGVVGTIGYAIVLRRT